MSHWRDNGMTFLQHFGFAIDVGLRLILAGVCCIIHAVLPFMFQTTASDCVKNLAEKFSLHRGLDQARKMQFSDSPPDVDSDSEKFQEI
jgi:hypothetical protein